MPHAKQQEEVLMMLLSKLMKHEIIFLKLQVWYAAVKPGPEIHTCHWM